MTMTANQYRKAIKQLDLNQREAGAFMRLTDRTSRNYAAKGAPEIVKMLLFVMLAKNITPTEVGRIMNRKESP